MSGWGEDQGKELARQPNIAGLGLRTPHESVLKRLALFDNLQHSTSGSAHRIGRVCIFQGAASIANLVPSATDAPDPPSSKTSKTRDCRVKCTAIWLWSSVPSAAEERKIAQLDDVRSAYFKVLRHK